MEDAEDAAGPTAQPAAADATAARNLTVGMVLDGIPESVAVGLTLLGGDGVSFALVGAVFLSNLPEAIGVAAALLAGGVPLRKVLVRFGAIVAVGFIAGLVGYAVLQPANADAIDHPVDRGRAMVVVVVNDGADRSVRRRPARGPRRPPPAVAALRPPSACSE